MTLAAHIPTYRPLRACGVEELAVHQFKATPSGGVLFARAPAGDEKRAAREAILELLTPEAWPGSLTMLTMPGLKWKFEGSLMKLREGDLRSDAPARTRLTCVENDRSIYHAALLRMPGIRNPKHTFHVYPSTSFAERCVSGLFVDRYYFGNVDDLMRAPPESYDAAWLDYTGPLSVARLNLIRHFFRHRVRRLLVVTALRARWARETSDAIDAAGGHSEWFWRFMGGERVHEINYQDGSPMAQFALQHTGGAS